jgi:hypothetical protein
MYRKQIAKMINFSYVEIHADAINLEDDRPTIMFGLHIENSKDHVAPFYITLTVHDHLLHNCMLDSGASHNLMPKVIMEKWVSRLLGHTEICILLIQEKLNVLV